MEPNQRAYPIVTAFNSLVSSIVLLGTSTSTSTSKQSFLLTGRDEHIRSNYCWTTLHPFISHKTKRPTSAPIRPFPDHSPHRNISDVTSRCYITNDQWLLGPCIPSRIESKVAVTLLADDSIVLLDRSAPMAQSVYFSDSIGCLLFPEPSSALQPSHSDLDNKTRQCEDASMTPLYTTEYRMYCYRQGR